MRKLTLLFGFALTFAVSANAQTCWSEQDCDQYSYCDGANYPINPGFCVRRSGGNCPGDCDCPGNNQCSCSPLGPYPGCVQFDGKIFTGIRPIPKGTSMSLISSTMKLPTREQLIEVDKLMVNFYIRRQLQPIAEIDKKGL